MFVCICKAVSDRHIRDAVRQGATSLRQVSRELGVGTCCGKCVPQARDVVSSALGTPSGATLKLADLMASTAVSLGAGAISAAA